MTPNVFNSSVAFSNFITITSSISASAFYGNGIGITTVALNQPITIIKTVVDTSFHWKEFFLGYFTYGFLLVVGIAIKAIQWMLCNDPECSDDFLK